MSYLVCTFIFQVIARQPSSMPSQVQQLPILSPAHAQKEVYIRVHVTITSRNQAEKTGSGEDVVIMPNLVISFLGSLWTF